MHKYVRRQSELLNHYEILVKEKFDGISGLVA